MKTVVPDYYKDFRCLAGECKHSCCIGWEIDIDDETLSYYRTVEGDFAKRLNDGISSEGGTAHFCMDSQGRCAFLNEKGLCDIMTNLGFDKVSQICDDHPRFRNFYSDRTEIGLGLSCEAVAQMLVNKKDRAQLVVLEDDEEWLWPEEWDFLDIRDKAFEILQDRALGLEARCINMLELCASKRLEFSAHKWADIFFTMERLDEERDVLLGMVKNTPEEELKLPCEEWIERAFEQLLVYFVFRHFTDSLDEDNLPQRAEFAVISAAVIYSMAAAVYKKYGDISPEKLADIARIYSAEIEYSTENTERILEILEENNNI